VQETRPIPENGIIQSLFHQANPRVDGGFVYNESLIGHDKDPAMLKEDLNWWRQQQFGMYPRSTQRRNIAVIDGLYLPEL
jgi:hypothetical protein